VSQLTCNARHPGCGCESAHRHEAGTRQRHAAAPPHDSGHSLAPGIHSQSSLRSQGALRSRSYTTRRPPHATRERWSRAIPHCRLQAAGEVRPCFAHEASARRQYPCAGEATPRASYPGALCEYACSATSWAAQRWSGSPSLPSPIRIVHLHIRRIERACAWEKEAHRQGDAGP